MPSRRMERVNDQIRSELSELIGRTLKDPRVAGLVSLTEVETSADLRHARVFVSVYGTEEDRASTLAALRHAAGFLRREIAQRMTMRTVPELDFQIDTSLEHGDRILRLLKEVQTPSVAPTAPRRRRASTAAADEAESC